MKLLKSLRNYFLRYIIFRGNDTEYLRYLGMKIAPGTRVDMRRSHVGSEPWLISLGSNVTLTQNVLLITHDGSSRLFRERVPQANPRFGNRYGTIVIEDNCFIGVASVILPGVKIGPNSIVGAGSIVSHDVPPNSVVAGNPARVICTLDEYIEKYNQRSIPIDAVTQDELRAELTAKLWK